VEGKLIIIVDIDNDLGKKAKIKGPVIGPEENLKAAVALASSDPEDSDANTIFKGLKLFRELKKKGKEVQIVTLTGDENLGAKATLKIARQLDRVLADYPVKSCIVVSDGESDNEVLPIISSRLKIDGVESVYVKQAKELEKTYFVILEKLKDPSYAKILIGIPAIIILTLSLMFLLNLKWQYIGFIIGGYLMIKGFGLDKKIDDIIKTMEISGNKLASAIFFLFIGILTLIGFIASYQAYQKAFTLGLTGLEAFAYSMDALLNILGFVALVSFLVKIVENYLRGNMIRLFSFLNYLILTIGTFIVLKTAFMWILNIEEPYISFETFLNVTIATTVFAYLIVQYINGLKIEVAMNLNLKDKDVFYEDNTYIGKVLGVDSKKQLIKIKTPLDKVISINIEKLKDMKSDGIIIEI